MVIPSGNTVFKFKFIRESNSSSFLGEGLVRESPGFPSAHCMPRSAHTVLHLCALLWQCWKACAAGSPGSGAFSSEWVRAGFITSDSTGCWQHIMLVLQHMHWCPVVFQRMCACVKCHQWLPTYGDQNVLSLTALLTCKLRAVTSLIEAIHLVFGSFSFLAVVHFS